MILIINPKTTKPAEVRKNFFREPNLGILYLAAVLDSYNIPVDILDLEQYIELSKAELKKAISNIIVNYRIFGITCLTNTFYIALDIARIIKKQNKNNYIILGGPHVSFLHKEILKNDFVTEKLIDFICVGESERSFLELVKILKSKLEKNRKIEDSELDLNSIKGISYINTKGKFIFTGYPDKLIDVESLPLPARYKLTQDNFFYNVANVIINRGCPNQCSFCSRTKLFKNVRIRSINSILTEIRDIISMQSYNYINFYDNINIDKDFFKDFCHMFIDNHIKIPWGCELRVDNISMEDAKLLKKAGCQLVATGIESASKTVLRKNFKFQDPNHVYQGVSNLKEFNIPIQAYFVLGLPGETEKSFYKTIEFIKTLPLDYNDTINYFVATPYPGSRLWEDKMYNIKIIEEDFSKYDCDHIIFETYELNKKILNQLYIVAKEIEKEYKIPIQ
ncbi:MAG: B12-binding domain-containing radical SAM protein [Candidatus Hodarchaeota archaeon]